MVKSFEDAFSFSSLLIAHKECRRNKQHKREVIDFELNLFKNLQKLSKDILNETYKIKYYRKFYVYEPKKRIIESLSYKHRVVQRALCKFILEPMLEPRLIDTNCACRINKGTGYAVKKAEQFLLNIIKKYGEKAYFLKMDATKYFASIKHSILLEKLKKLNFEAKTFRLIKMVITSYNSSAGIGLPIGNQTSQWFALSFLNEIDRKIKEDLRAKCYVRYMDDLLLISNSREKLEAIKNAVFDEAKQIELSFFKKCEIGTLNKGFVFLGFKYFLKNGKLNKVIKNSSINRVNKMFKRVKFFYNSGLVNRDFVEKRKICIAGHYKKAKGIKKIDIFRITQSF